LDKNNLNKGIGGKQGSDNEYMRTVFLVRARLAGFVPVVKVASKLKQRNSDLVR